MSKEKTELQKKEPTAVAPAHLMAAMEADAGQGYANFTSEDTAKPHMVLLQDLTPICKKTSGSYVEGATPGTFFNTVTNELIDGDKGFFVIPCGYQRRFIAKEVGENGKFVQMLDTGDPSVRDAIMTDSGGKRILLSPENLELIDVRYHFTLASANNEAYEPIVIGLKKTQIPKSKTWNTLMGRQRIKTAKGLVKVAPWYQIYHVTAKAESKDKYSWYGWDIKFHGFVQDASVAKLGKEFYDLVIRGNVDVGEAKHVVDVAEEAPF